MNKRRDISNINYMKKIKIIFVYFFLFNFSQHSALAVEQYEDENWKCLVQNITEEKYFDGFVECTSKNEDVLNSSYVNFNNGIIESIMFEKSLDGTFISFYQNDGNSWKRNGLSINLYDDNSFTYSQYKDGYKNGCHAWISDYEENDMSFTIFSSGSPDKNFLYENRKLINVTKNTVEAKIEAYYLNDDYGMLENSFYYTSDTVLDRNNEMRPISSNTHFAKMDENGFFGHGVLKTDEESYLLNYDKKDNEGNPTTLALEDLDSDVLHFNSVLTKTNNKKLLCLDDFKNFISELNIKYGINFDSKFQKINFELENYINDKFNIKLPDNYEVYSNLKIFFETSILSNQILYQCKEDHDKEMGLSIFSQTLNAALIENIIDENQFDQLNKLILPNENKADDIVNQKGCNFASNLVYTDYRDKMLEAQISLQELGAM